MLDFHALTASLSFSSATRVVVVGGTQGIGGGIALRFAQLGASVCIVGRNPNLGAELIVKMREASTVSAKSRSDGARFEFVRADLSSVRGMHEAVKGITAWAGEGGVQYLYQSQGGLSANMLNPSVSAMKTAFNAQILSHFLIQDRLQSSGVLKPGAQSCHIAKPGIKNRTVDVNDIRALQGQEGKGIFGGRVDALERWIVLFDYMTKEFNIRYPTTHTTHLFPGYVPTQHMVHPSLPLPLRILSHLAAFILSILSLLPAFILSFLPFLQFGLTPIKYADVAIYETVHPNSESLAGEPKREFWDHIGREVQIDPSVEDASLREGVWKALVKFSEEE